MQCQKCGKPLGKGDLFCPECGCKAEQKSNGKVAVIVIAAVVIVFILVVIGVWLSSGFDKPAKKTEKTAVSESEEKKTREDSETESAGFQDENMADESEDIEEETGEATSFERDYIIFDSNSAYLSESDLAGLSLQEINYAKNEIYARHGRKFKSAELQQYFESKSWYTGRYEPDYFDQNYSGDVLNDYEKKNAELLRNKEFSINPAGYQLDQ